jgi:hypothetical protein
MVAVGVLVKKLAASNAPPGVLPALELVVVIGEATALAGDAPADNGAMLEADRSAAVEALATDVAVDEEVPLLLAVDDDVSVATVEELADAEDVAPCDWKRFNSDQRVTRSLRCRVRSMNRRRVRSTLMTPPSWTAELPMAPLACPRVECKSDQKKVQWSVCVCVACSTNALDMYDGPCGYCLGYQCFDAIGVECNTRVRCVTYKWLLS